jgi:tRNA dimethylallyltransferase
VREIPVIAGPTASGKTDLAVEIALALRARGHDAEIVTADAYQVYRGMDIGTAKPSMDERRGVTHHLIDLVAPTARFTVADWLGAAETAIGEIQARGARPIVVGGTHLYIKALLDGLFDGPAGDAALREELRSLGREALRAELERVDPDAAGRIHPNDERRTVRALEVYRLTGRPISAQQTQWDRDDATARFRLITIQWPIEDLNRRINARVRAMMTRGLLEEARGLWQGGRLGPQAREALGYKQLIPVFEGTRTLEEAVERIKVDTRRFAKSQRTWIRRLGADSGAVRIDAGAMQPQDWAGVVLERLNRGWLGA